MDEATRDLVRVRADHRCEYCRLRQSALFVVQFQIEHIVAKKHGGDDDPENLALACLHCNLHKGSDLSGIDPLTGAMTRLFHPRRDKWHEHFRFDRTQIVGITDVGRITVRLLNVNSNQQVQIREAALRG
jgi:hypothetical protein